MLTGFAQAFSEVWNNVLWLVLFGAVGMFLLSACILVSCIWDLHRYGTLMALRNLVRAVGMWSLSGTVVVFMLVPTLKSSLTLLILATGFIIGAVCLVASDYRAWGFDSKRFITAGPS